MKQFRKLWTLLIGLIVVAPVINAQSQFLPTNYDEPYRGQFHFSQQSGWMNDINGIWYQDGVYHLTYQSDPYSLDGGRGQVLRYWGHATSTDLVHWVQQPTILNPGENVPGECWSGSTVIDFNNTSGFGTAENPPVITIYSATNNIGTCLAYSLDKGTTWVGYEHNPVNVATTNAYETRDPHVFWYEPTQKWVCIVYENGFTFYNSPDLKTWTKATTFGTGWGYECPDMFELPVDDGATKKFVIVRADGEYYVGDFNGTAFTPDAGFPQKITYNGGFGGGFYASQTFFQKNFPGGKAVQMAWMLGLGPGSTAPWTHNSTFPVEIKLKTFPEGIRATRNPVAAIETLYQSTKIWNNESLQKNQNLLTGKLSKTFDLEVVLDVANTAARAVTFQFANKQVSYNITGKTLLGQSLKPVDNKVKIHFLVDWGGLEIFGNDGAFSWVENFKFTPSDAYLSMHADDNITVVSARFSEVKRTWSGTPNNTCINNTNSENSYSGNWLHLSEGGYYNNDCAVGLAAGSYVEYTFSGKQISWYGLKNNDLGIASVYIDNEFQEDIDCYSTFRVVQQLFTKTDLTDAEHIIKVMLKGTKNPASTGIALVHDYFGYVSEYVDLPDTRPIITDDASASIIYNGTWNAVTNENLYYSNTCHYNRSAEADFQFTFTGTHISWYGLKNNDLGFATVYIDEKRVAEIDCYSNDRRVYLLLDMPLPEGSHTIKIKVAGVKNPASTGFALVHDYFAFTTSDAEVNEIVGMEDRVPPTTTANDIQHFIMYGQSLSTGHEASPVSTANVTGNYMLGSQIWINYGNNNHTWLFPLTANIARGLSDLSESPLHGAVNHIRLKQNVVSPQINNRFIATSAGVSGQSIESLSKESQQDMLYDNYKNALYYGWQVAEQENSAITCPAIFWLQGEWNYTTEGNGMTEGTRPTADKDEYKSLLVTLKNNMQDEVQTNYFQEEKPLFITYQVGAQYTRGTKLPIGMAQLEASNENNDIICAGPVYPMTDVGGHLDGNGYRWYGEMLGKVYYKTKIQGEDFKPLQPKYLARVAGEAKKIRITYHVPVLPLVLDVNTLKQTSNYGFNVSLNNRTQPIENVQVVNDSTVELTCRNDITTGTIAISYANSQTQGHGNLRDSDPCQAFFNYEKLNKIPPSGEPKDENGNVIYGKPYPLYNFSVAFYYEIPEDADNYVVPTFTYSSTGIPHIAKEKIAVWQSGRSLLVKLPEQGFVSVNVYNLLGEKKRQFTEEWLFQGTTKEYLLPQMTAGLYIVEIKSRDQVQSLKLVL